jgi:predicted transcriptional regulator
MDEGMIDREAMGRMAKALVYIKGAKDPTAVALKTASETGKPADIKKARQLFLKLKPSDRKGALAMLSDD